MRMSWQLSEKANSHISSQTYWAEVTELRDKQNLGCYAEWCDCLKDERQTHPLWFGWGQTSKVIFSTRSLICKSSTHIPKMAAILESLFLCPLKRKKIYIYNFLKKLSSSTILSVKKKNKSLAKARIRGAWNLGDSYSYLVRISLKLQGDQIYFWLQNLKFIQTLPVQGPPPKGVILLSAAKALALCSGDCGGFSHLFSQRSCLEQ